MNKDRSDWHKRWASKRQTASSVHATLNLDCDVWDIPLLLSLYEILQQDQIDTINPSAKSENYSNSALAALPEFVDIVIDALPGLFDQIARDWGIEATNKEFWLAAADRIKQAILEFS
jgi:hypothetical protein